jgi:UDP-3-O-acyl-N-acetylglucosamine deacetylase
MNNGQVQSNQNNFFGIKVSQPGINVNNAGPTQLIYSSDYSTDTWYNNGQVVMTIGQLSSGVYGTQIDNGTISISNDGVEQIRIGLLPDGSYGMVITKPGISVDQAYGT